MDCLASHDVSGPPIHADPNHAEGALIDCFVYDHVPYEHVCRPWQRVEAATLLHERVSPILIPPSHVVIAAGQVGLLVVHRDVEDKIQWADSEVVGGHMKDVLVSAGQLNITVTLGLQVDNRMERIDIPQDEDPRLWMNEYLAKNRPFKLARPGRADWQVDRSGTFWVKFSNYPGPITAISLVVQGEFKLVPG